MIKKAVWLLFAVVIGLCSYSNFAFAATGTYTATIPGKITILSCHPLEGQDQVDGRAQSTLLSVTIQEGDIPSNAVVKNIVIKFGDVDDIGGGPLFINQILLVDPKGNMNSRACGCSTGGDTVFNEDDIAGSPLSPHGTWSVGYIGACPAGSGSLSLTGISLTFTYDY